MSEEFTPEEIAILSRYVTNPTGNTFCVNIPGLAGPIYARYSRAVTGLRRTLLKEFLKDGELNVIRTQELIERILNEYGDDSVGELEGAHLALEQISNIATKIVEDCRIGGSPIEQSTRYVFYYQKDTAGRYRYYRGKEIVDSAIGEEYVRTLDFIFDTYASCVEPLTEHFRTLKPLEEAEYDIRGAGQPERYGAMDSEVFQKQFRMTYNFDLKTKACDVLRCLLPAATLTNVGLFGNGRFYQGLLTKLYSSSLPECNRRGREAHDELNKIIPKFVKRANRDEYQAEREINMRRLAAGLLHGLVSEKEQDCALLPMPKDPPALLEQTIAGCLYPYTTLPFHQLLTIVRQLSQGKRNEILATYVGERKNRRQRPGRAFEQGYPLLFDVHADFGAYRDLQRHRMLSQERQLLHPGLGYAMPEELEAIEMKEKTGLFFARSAKLHSAMTSELGAETAQYAVLFGYRIRWMMGMNFREAMHLIELRTTPQGHPSYRNVCQQMMRALQAEHPDLAATIKFADFNTYYWSRGESEAKQRRKERELDDKFRSS